MKSIWAVVPAAGSGRRLGGEIPKQYREIAGAPLMEHTLQALLASPDVRGIVVALDPSDRRADAINSLADVRVQTVAGGAERAHEEGASAVARIVTVVQAGARTAAAAHARVRAARACVCLLMLRLLSRGPRRHRSAARSC